jgi:hypothetical protein
MTVRLSNFTTGRAPRNTKITQPLTQGVVVQNHQIGYINGTNVFLRPAPSRKGGEAFLQPNYKVEILGAKNMSDGKWFNVKYNGREGWVFAKFVSVNSGSGVNTPPKPKTPEPAPPKKQNEPVKPTPGNNKQLAQNYVKQGEDLWKKADWSKAYEAFSKAYEIYPDPQTKIKRDNAYANLQAVKKEAEAKKQAAAAEAQRRREQEQAKLKAEAEAREAERRRQEEAALKKQKQNEVLGKLFEAGIRIGGEALQKKLSR